MNLKEAQEFFGISFKKTYWIFGCINNATQALQNGVNIKTVSSMPGHFSAGFTLDTYAHVTTAAQKDAANTMGSMLVK